MWIWKRNYESTIIFIYGKENGKQLQEEVLLA